MTCTTKRGMTRERWEEIKALIEKWPSNYEVAKELKDWIVGNDVTFPLEFDEPPRPVVIDGPGRYWRKNVKTGAIDEAELAENGRDRWHAPYPGHESGGYGATYDIYGEPVKPWCSDCQYRIVAKVAYRQRPLTPDEAFKLLGRTIVWKQHSGFTRKIAFVGESRVTLNDGSEVELSGLAEHYRLDDGSPLSVTEPVPFSEPSHDL